MNKNFLIEESDIQAAQQLCANFKNTKLAARSAAFGVGAIIAKRFFEDTECEVDFNNSLFYIEDIVKDYEISDVYVNDNYIDVRIYFDEKEICVPKIHFDKDILPLAYMFIKVSEDLTNAEVSGFIIPDTITRMDDSVEYYPVNENALVPFEEIEYMFRSADDLYNVEEAEIFEFNDGENENIQSFVRKLVLSADGRRRLHKAIISNFVFNKIEISSSEEIAEPKTLDNSPYEELLLNPDEDSEESFEPIQEINEIPEIDEIPAEESEIEEETEEEYQYSTVASPKFEFDESDLIEPESESGQQEITEEAIENDNIDSQSEEVLEEESQDESAEEIDTLFNEDSTDENIEEVVPVKKKTPPILLILVLTALIAGGGYFAYTTLAQKSGELPPVSEESVPQQVSSAEEAMPVETVEKESLSQASNEGNAVSIPAIEQNLDASILVSNLKIDWEVPAGYVSNTAAKRYLVKLGKIIQLNLKTELLLLNRPPISNKIAVELKYNDNTKAFDVVGMTISSGEKSVDDIIMDTIKNALNMKLNINTDIFGKLSGNPTIVIKL